MSIIINCLTVIGMYYVALYTFILNQHPIFSIEARTEVTLLFRNFDFENILTKKKSLTYDSVSKLSRALENIHLGQDFLI